MRDGRLQHAEQLFLIAREGPSDEGSAQLDRQSAGVNRRKIVDDAGLQLGTDVSSRRELTLRQPVHTVVFDDVNHRQIAAHEVNELPDPDRGRIAVSADAETDQVAVREHRSGGHRRHASMDGVKAVRPAHEIGGALR